MMLSRHTSKLLLRFCKHFRYFSASSNAKITSSYYHELGTFTFLQHTIGDLVDEAARHNGDDVMLTFPFQNISKTFYQFKEETDQLASGLISLGLVIGDRIAIYGPNSYQWLLTQYAALKAGLIVVTVNPAYTAQELAYTLEKVDCRAIVAPESFKTSEYYKIICSLMPEIPTSHPGQIKSQRLKQLQNVIMMSDKSFPGTYKLQDIIDADSNSSREILSDTRRKIQFDHPAIIMFTSGTTGVPKGAALSHFQIVNQTKSFMKRAGYDKEKPVICSQVPLFHGFGTLGGIPLVLHSKGKCVFPSEYFDPVASIKAIEDEKCTDVFGVPTMLNEMVKRIRGKQHNFNHWKQVLVGAAPVPLELTKCLQDEFGLTILNAYGATETTAGLCSQSQLDSRRTYGSSGKAIEHVEIKIVDQNGDILPINTNGEILTRSPFVFIGYWGDAQKTAEALDNARWYHTGDVGKMDEEGNIYVTGRIKDMVIRGGENIYPTEIENFLLTHPSIADVYVVGVPDERLGEELCASIEVKPGCTITEDEIKEFCKGKISYFKVPRYVLTRESFPKTESGKVIKDKLREECKKELNL